MDGVADAEVDATADANADANALPPAPQRRPETPAAFVTANGNDTAGDTESEAEVSPYKLARPNGLRYFLVFAV